LGVAAKAIYGVGALSVFLLLQIYDIGSLSISRLSFFRIFLPLHKRAALHVQKKVTCQILKSFLLILRSTLTPHNKQIKNEFEIATKHMSIKYVCFYIK